MSDKNAIIFGYGKLGRELNKQAGYPYLCREFNGFDFCKPKSYQRLAMPYGIIINCVANTNTYSADKESMMNTNFKAVCDLVDYCNVYDKKIVHISTDYIYAGSDKPASEDDVPVHAKNWYSYSKLLADGYVQTRANNYLLVRTSFKPTPFPWQTAITTQKGNFDYIDVIASIILDLIEQNVSGIINVGTREKTIYELAKTTKPDVVASSDILNPTMPRDITMNLNKQNALLERIKNES